MLLTLICHLDFSHLFTTCTRSPSVFSINPFITVLIISRLCIAPLEFKRTTRSANSSHCFNIKIDRCNLRFYFSNFYSRPSCLLKPLPVARQLFPSKIYLQSQLLYFCFPETCFVMLLSPHYGFCNFLRLQVTPHHYHLTWC